MAKKKKKKKKEESIVIEETKDHYIDNKLFYNEMVVWKQLCEEAENSDEKRPPVTEYIGMCFMNIAEHLARKGNFVNYPYKEEMISDGIENCLMYAHNFNPEKSKNPFSYFTQIIYYAFLRRIEKEKKQAYIKLKMTELMDDGSFHKWFKENYFEKDTVQEALTEHFQISENDIKKFEPKKKKKKRK
jgi:hypothetical protein